MTYFSTELQVPSPHHPWQTIAICRHLFEDVDVTFCVIVTHVSASVTRYLFSKADFTAHAKSA